MPIVDVQMDEYTQDFMKIIHNYDREIATATSDEEREAAKFLRARAFSNYMRYLNELKERATNEKG